MLFRSILADGPIRRMKQHKVTERGAVAKDEVDGEDGGVFELNDWVYIIESGKL